MIYLVTGYPKSGTSAFMGGCDAGGVATLRSADTDAQLAAVNDTDEYVANERYFEPSKRQIAEWDFPRAYDGVAMKWLKNFMPEWKGGVQTLAPWDYRVVLMTRDPEEIRQSYNAMLAKRGLTAANQAPWLDFGPEQRAEYDKRTDLILDHIESRRDVQLDGVIRYREGLIADPLGVYTDLAEKGWPLDPVEAAAAIDPTKCRARREDLWEGVA